MKVNRIVNTIRELECEYRDFGSLDFECDFCSHNSYGKNFHFRKNGEHLFCICEDCLKIIKEEELTYE